MPESMATHSGVWRTRLLGPLLWMLLLPLANADTVDLREWLVPWPDSSPTDPYVDSRGRVWFVGVTGDYIANFSRDSNEFNRYDLRDGSQPTALLISPDGQLWYTSLKRRSIGVLNPSTGRVTEHEIPHRRAREPRAMIFDGNGDIWFTAENSQFAGKLAIATGEIDLVELPIKNPRPLGLAAAPDGSIWIAAPGRSALLRIDGQTLAVTIHTLPDGSARPRRLGFTSNGSVWYTDSERGLIGRLTPTTGEIGEWFMPGGTESAPYALAIDRYDRLWVVETGSDPNRLVGFDTESGIFVTETDIPSGAGSVSHLHYSESTGEVWFGTETNYLGRAVVH